jgi:hypothetical protein
MRAEASAGPSGEVKEPAAFVRCGLGGTWVRAGSRQTVGPSSRRRVGVDSGIRRWRAEDYALPASAPTLAHHGTTPVIPDSPRRPFVATSQMRGDGGEYKPAGMTGHKFFEIGLTGAETLGVGKMNECRLGHRKWGESPQPSCSNTGSSPRKRGPLFKWRNGGSRLRGNDLVGGAATTSLSVRHGRTRSGHPDACARCADSSAGSAGRAPDQVRGRG